MAHILLPTDFSDPSLNACAYALDLFGTQGHRYTLMHSYLDPVPGYAAMVDMSSAMYAASLEGLAAFAKRFSELPAAGHAVVSTEVVYGPLTSALSDLARERSADMIVMGTHGAGGMVLFGSNAGAVAKASRTPALIVPKDAHFKGLRRILFADDHTRVEPLAMRPMIELAQRYDAEIVLAHVLRDARENPDPRVVADYATTLSGAKHRYCDAEGDDVAQALSNAADHEHADLVAVLHRHTGILESLVHGSVAKQLAMHSRIPLLVLEH